MKICCQTAGGQPAGVGEVATGRAIASAILSFFAERSSSRMGVLAVPASVSLSLRFAPACDGPSMSESAEAVELDASDTSISEESPSLSSTADV